MSTNSHDRAASTESEPPSSDQHVSNQLQQQQTAAELHRVQAELQAMHQAYAALQEELRIATGHNKHEQSIAQAALRASKDRYHTLFDSIDEGFCVIEVLFDENNKPVDYYFHEVNPAFTRHTGLENAIGRRIRDLAPTHEEYWFEIYGKIVLTGQPMRFENHAQAFQRFFDVYAFPIDEPAQARVAVLFTDITKRKQAETSLQHLNATLEQAVETRTAQVQALAARLTIAEQEERRRISQILHDDLQQLLYGIQMRTMSIITDAAAEQAPLRQQQAEDIYRWLGDAIQTTRQLTVDLSPPLLKNEGVADALGWLVTQMAKVNGLQVTLRVLAPCALPDEAMQVLIFQIVRELLLNVVKHAQTAHATVELNQGTAGACMIKVQDEGCGFDVAILETNPRRGFGLFSVQERLKLFGGRMEIVSVPGQGTLVTLIAPVTATPQTTPPQPQQP